MTLTPSRAHILAAIAGMVSMLAFAPFYFSGVTIITTAIIYYLACDGYGAKHGLSFGIGFFTLSVSWVFTALYHFGHLSLFLSSILLSLFVILLASLFALLLWAYQKLQVKLNLKAYSFASGVVFTSLWVLMEYVRTYVLHFPWLLWGYSLEGTPLRAFAPLVGVMGLTAVSIALSCGLVSAWMQPELRLQYIVILILSSAAALSLDPVNWTQVYGAPIQVALVQANIDQEHKKTLPELEQLLMTYDRLTQQEQQATLIVWPESAIPLPSTMIHNFLQRVLQPLLQQQRFLLLGLTDFDPNRANHYYNSLHIIGSKQHNIYHKRHLVIFGEYIPFGEWLGPWFDLFQLPFSTFNIASKSQPLLKMGHHRIAGLICYDAAFSEDVAQQVRDADMMVTISDSSWFGQDLFPAQFLQIQQMRALELGRYHVVSNNTGISAIIDHRGQIIFKLAPGTQTSGHHLIRTVKGRTPFSHLPRFSVAYLALGSLFTLMML